MRAPPPLAESADSQALLQALLDTSRTGLLYLRPVYAAGQPAEVAEVVDLAYVRLNPTAQRLLGLPEHPTATVLAPAPGAAAVFAFYRDAFLAGQAGHHDYDHAGVRLHAVAQRTGALLAVSLTERELAAPKVAPRYPAGLPATGVAQRVLAQASTALCLLRGPAHRIEYANPAFEKLFPGRRLVGRLVTEALPEVPQQALQNLLIQLSRTGGSLIGPDLALEVAEGEELAQTHYFSLRYQAYPEDGPVGLITVTAFDVTRQVLAQQQRERQRAEWQRLFEQAPIAIAVLRGPEHLIELANPAMCALWSTHPAQLLEQPLFEALPATATSTVRHVLAEVLATGQSHAHERLAIFSTGSAGGSQRHWSFGYHPLREPDDQVTGIAVVAHEVSAQLRDRQQVQELNEELRSLNEELQLTNEELNANNAELVRAQQQLGQLNRNLETRVAAGVQAAQQARDEAEHQRQRLAYFFQQVPAAICVFDGPRLVYELVNADYQRLLPGRALLGRPLLEALPELAGTLTWQTLQQVYHTGETHEEIGVRVAIARSEGGPMQDFYLHYIQQARYDEHGRIDGVFMFILNITEQILAHQRAEKLQAEVLATMQRQVQEHETFYQVFEETSALVALMWGPEHRFEYLNRSFQHLFPGRQLRHRALTEALPELATQGVADVLDHVYRTGEPYHSTELPLTTTEADGTTPRTIYLTVTYQAYLEEGQPRGISVFAYDVTEQVLARQAVVASAQQAQALAQSLLVANEQLTRTNTDLDNFIYTASHDLKAPIANIESLLLLLRKQLPAEARQAGLVPRVLGMMQGAIERFQLTIAQLTDLAKLQHAHSQPAEEVDLRAVVEAVRLDLAPLLAEAQLVVSLDSCATISFAPQHLRSLIYNLLSNALKYRHPQRPPVVQLRCHHHEATTVLEVQDNGLGLTIDQQHKLFTMFRRLHDHVPGSGVGLYMVKRMVENAGGTISVQSQPDVGSTFTVTLPT